MAAVGLIMGSDSDWKIMKSAYDLLVQAGLGCDVKIASAHRTPAEAFAWVGEAESRGNKVIIAAAGKAAHLPGVVAAHTVLPVIGVPMGTSDLGGMDSLYSIVQMPSGVPVATVAIDGAKNAALLAIQIIAVFDVDARVFIGNFRAKQAEEVRKKDHALQESLKK